MKKIVILFIVCILAVSTMFGCGENNESSAGGYEVSIVVDDLIQDKIGLNKWTEQRQKAFDTKYPEIKVKHIAEIGTDSFNQIMAIKNILSVHNSNTPTILRINTNEFARQLYIDGYLGDFTAQINSWSEKENIATDILDGYTYGDKIVGFPVQVSTPMLGFNKNVLKDRKDALTAIGQNYESLKIESWEDYRNIAAALTYNDDSNKKIAGAGMTTQDYYQSFGVWSIANGFDGVVQNEDGTITIDFAENESFVETLSHFAKMKEDKTIGYNVDVSVTTYYSYIWNGSIASFTYYPDWATWFASNGLDSSNIDVYPFPQGEYAKKNNISAISPVFASGYICDKKATKEQIDAAALYIEFMYGKDAWTSKINFAYNNMIEFVAFPSLNDVELSKVYTDMTENWKNAITVALDHKYVGQINSVAYTTEIRAKLSDLVSSTNITTMKETLATLEKTTKLNWLNNYNASIKG